MTGTFLKTLKISETMKEERWLMALKLNASEDK